MESVITRHVVMQSVHADRRFAPTARFGAMTEADVGSLPACHIGCRKPSAQFPMKQMRYAATQSCITVYSGSRPGGRQRPFDQNNSAFRPQPPPADSDVP